MELSSCYQVILKRNAKVFNEHYFELRGKYISNNIFRFGSGYRYTWNKGTPSKLLSLNNRINIDFQFRKKLKPFNIRHRLRPENTNGGSKLNFINDSIEASFIRNQLTFSRKITTTKLYPYVVIVHYSNYTGNTEVNNKLKIIAGIQFSHKNLVNFSLAIRPCVN